jgi:Zn-dependent peptidase ImmA (M78 family)
MQYSFDYEKIPYLSKKDIAKIADDFLNINWNRDIPVDIELIAEQKYDIIFTPIIGLQKQISTDAWLLSNCHEINYDPDQNDFRIRFSVAHEMGHYLLHSEYISKTRTNNFEDYKTVLYSIPDALWTRVETQANDFAGNVLMPLKHIETRLESLRLDSTYDGSNIFKAAEKYKLNEQEFRGIIAAKIARDFEVTESAMKTRLNILGIKPNDYK